VVWPSWLPAAGRLCTAPAESVLVGERLAEDELGTDGVVPW
jgi:hypothetical protein